jgi:glycosyltransferase involved in cell wall biosynthesis
MKIHDQRPVALPELWFLGTIPPPATGMTLMTKQILEALQTARCVTFCNWSPGMSRRGIRFRLRRAYRVGRSMFAMFGHGRVRNARLYIVANSSAGGLFYTCMLTAAARWLGYQIYLHHHAYSYIDQFDRRMSWTDRMLGANGFHVVHCEKMIRDFRAQYAGDAGFLTIYPSVVSLPTKPPRTAVSRPFRLGHMSNLTIEKGLDLVIEVFRGLRQQGHSVSLTLAGPCQTAGARLVVEKALADYPGSVYYLGPVYDDAKERFFAEIDAFLFPTRYKNESWGIVLNESLAAAVPVIACNRGCVSAVVSEGAGVVVDRDTDFPRIATDTILRWMSDPASYAATSAAAVEQAEELHREAAVQLQQFVEHMCLPIHSEQPVS